MEGKRPALPTAPSQTPSASQTPSEQHHHQSGEDRSCGAKPEFIAANARASHFRRWPGPCAVL